MNLAARAVPGHTPIAFVVRALLIAGVVVGIAGMHNLLSLPTTHEHRTAVAAESASSDSINASARTEAPFDTPAKATVIASDSMGETMVDMMHACLFLVAAVVLALLAEPAFLGRIALLLPKLLVARQQWAPGPHGADHPLVALCVLRI